MPESLRIQNWIFRKDFKAHLSRTLASLNWTNLTSRGRKHPLICAYRLLSGCFHKLLFLVGNNVVKYKSILYDFLSVTWKTNLFSEICKLVLLWSGLTYHPHLPMQVKMVSTTKRRGELRDLCAKETCKCKRLAPFTSLYIAPAICKVMCSSYKIWSPVLRGK